jgi:large subunit ribosomal protein L28
VSAVCDICAKKPQFGNKVARLGRNAQKRRIQGRAKRLFRPNVQPVRVVIDGTPRRLTVCTSCLKAGKVARAPR